MVCMLSYGPGWRRRLRRGGRRSRPAIAEAARPTPARDLFSRRVLESEAIHLRPAITIGKGDAPALQFPDGHFRSRLRKARRGFQAILKYLLDHIGHPIAAGVVEPCPPPIRRVGNDHDMPAFHLQAIDGGKLVPVVEEKDVFPVDLASSTSARAVRGEVDGVLHKGLHLTPQGIGVIESPRTAHSMCTRSRTHPDPRRIDFAHFVDE